MAVTPDPDVAAVVYERSIAELDAQRGTVDELRSRAGVVLGAASIASSFLGGLALADGGTLGGWAVAAIAAFVVVGLLVFAILWPYNWSLGFEPYDLVNDYADADPPRSVAGVHRDLAIYAGDYLASNQRLLTILWWAYRVAIVALVASIISWLLAMGGA